MPFRFIQLHAQRLALIYGDDKITYAEVMRRMKRRRAGWRRRASGQATWLLF